MNVDNLHKFYGTTLDIQLSAKLKMTKGTISKWRANGIPPERQAIFQVLSNNRLKADLSGFDNLKPKEVEHG